MSCSYSHWLTGWRRIFCGFLLSLSLLTCSAETNAPEVWLNHYSLDQFAGATEEDWSRLKPGLTTTFFYLHTLWDGVIPRDFYITPEQLRKTLVTLRKRNTAIAIEGGYFDWKPYLSDANDPQSKIYAQIPYRDIQPGIGAATAATELNKMRNLIELGEAPDFLLLDGPMRRLTVPGQDQPGSIASGLSQEKAAKEVVGYMKAMRRQFPNVKFVVILNFPNWGWKGGPAYHQTPGGTPPMNWGDAHQAMESLFNELSRHQLELHAIQADFPWRYYLEKSSDPVSATVNWRARLSELEKYARRKDARFNLVLNSESGYLSAKQFSEDSLRYLDGYLANGGQPDAVLVQSWYPHPKDVLPVTETYTSGWLAGQFIDRLREFDSGKTPIAAPPPVVREFNRSEASGLCHLMEFLEPEATKEIIQKAKSRWLELPVDPPAAQAAEVLTNLRIRAATIQKKHPNWVVVYKENNQCKLKSANPTQLNSMDSKVVLEVVNLTKTSKQLTAWIDHHRHRSMKPVWIPPSGSRLIAVDLDSEELDPSSFSLNLGLPESDSAPASLTLSKTNLLPISKPSLK